MDHHHVDDTKVTNDDGDVMQTEIASKEEDEEEEEDWSHLFPPQKEGKTLMVNGDFARHDSLQEIPLRIPSYNQHNKNDDNRHNDNVNVPYSKVDTITLRIASVTALSPLDMINLSWGTSDATGHRIWLGAELFVHALSSWILTPYFTSKTTTKILELGSGTGLAGIAIVKAYPNTNIVLTDSSTSALTLCEKNCHLNHLSNDDRIQIRTLLWGNTLHVGNNDDIGANAAPKPERFDVVVAADILYDLNMWKPILETIRLSLDEKKGGVFILAHVPRAALPEEDPLSQQRSIEDILIEQAKSFGFVFISTIHPKDLHTMTIEEKEDMEAIGAAILIWQKT